MVGKAAGKKKSAGASDDEPIVVEGEIISEDIEPADVDSVSAASSGWGSKLPWIIAGLMLVFVSGLFAAPWAEDSLRRIAPGLMPSEETIDPLASADSARITANENALAGLKARADSGDVARADMATRIAALESDSHAVHLKEATTPETAMPDLSPIEARLTALELERGSPVDQPAELGEQSGGDLPSGDLPSGDLIERLARLEAAVAAQPTNLDGVEFSVPAGGVDLAIVTARLIQRLGAGQPYETELLTTRALVGGMLPERATQYSDVLGAIETGSKTGVSTIESLQAQFDDLAADVYRAANAPLDAPWWQRLWNSLKSAVTVRPTGDISGEDAGATIARAEVRLAERDVSAALAELETLPEAAQVVAAAWLEAARARSAADAAAHELLTLLEQREPAPITPSEN